MTSDPIVVQQTYHVPVAALWKAITDPDQMRQWFFEPMTDFQPVVGFETSFCVHHEGQDYVHQWKIVDVEPEQRIVYQWSYESIPGSSNVTWELSGDPQGSTLTLTHAVTEPFPQDNPVFSRESGQAGWDFLLREMLKNFLDS